MCLTTKTDIIITVPTSKEPNVHTEIVKLICIGDGKCVRYEYNKKLIDKYGINASNPKLSRIEAIISDAFEKEKVYSLISPEVENRLAKAIETAAKELIKMM